MQFEIEKEINIDFLIEFSEKLLHFLLQLGHVSPTKKKGKRHPYVSPFASI